MSQLLYAPPRPAVRAHATALRAAGELADALLVEELAAVPSAVWLCSGDVGDAISSTAEAAAAVGAMPVFVLYVIPNRDVGQYSAGGAASDEEYMRLVDQLYFSFYTSQSE